MRVFLNLFVSLVAPVALLAQTPAAAQPPAGDSPAGTTGMTDEQKTIYALGLTIARQIAPFTLAPPEVELLEKGIADGIAGKSTVSLEEETPKIQSLYMTRSQAAAEKQKTASVAYLAKAAAEPGAIKTESGLVYKDERVGTGPSPKATDKVKVNYRGTLIDGTEFDSSYKRNAPATFPLNGVIPCWTEGVQKMKVGGKATLTCPASIAYGDRGTPGIPGGATLIFEVELLEIE